MDSKVCHEDVSLPCFVSSLLQWQYTWQGCHPLPSFLKLFSCALSDGRGRDSVADRHVSSLEPPTFAPYTHTTTKQRRQQQQQQQRCGWRRQYDYDISTSIFHHHRDHHHHRKSGQSCHHGEYPGGYLFFFARHVQNVFLWS